MRADLTDSLPEIDAGLVGKRHTDRALNPLTMHDTPLMAL